jgi:hypothetical protein
MLSTFRLSCRSFWTEARLTRLNGRWLASADTPDGPSLGCDWTARGALIKALEAFDGAVEELLETAPPELFERDPHS